MISQYLDNLSVPHRIVSTVSRYIGIYSLLTNGFEFLLTWCVCNKPQVYQLMSGLIGKREQVPT